MLSHIKIKRRKNMLKLLVDSDFLIANYRRDDPSFEKATKAAIALNKKGAKLYCLNLVVQESTTVLSKKMGMHDAKKFYTGLNNFIDIFVLLDEKLEKRGWELFLKQTKKGTSFVDCANIAVVEKYKFDGILSFDKFYSPKYLKYSS